MGVGEEAVVANAMETGRQHVEQEAPHELADVEAHDLALVTTALPIVLPAETDMGLVKIEQAAVSDCDAMRVAREIGQDLLGTGEGLDRKSTRLNSSHLGISYAVFCRHPPRSTLFPYTTLFRSKRRMNSLTSRRMTLLL